MTRPVVLVHGAWHGPWCWDKVTPLLDQAGVPWLAPDLPSAAAASDGGDLSADVALVESLLDALPGDAPAVLCGHSRGGLVLSEAGTHPRAGHLVYLAALLLEAGEKSADVIGGTGLLTSLDRAEDGTFLPRLAAGAELFYNDCSGTDVSWALGQVRPQNMGGSVPKPPREAWRSTPSTYVVCGHDRALSPEGQRRIAVRAGATLEWDTGHSPFISRPDLLAALLIGLSRG